MKAEGPRSREHRSTVWCCISIPRLRRFRDEAYAFKGSSNLLSMPAEVSGLAVHPGHTTEGESLSSQSGLSVQPFAAIAAYRVPRMKRLWSDARDEAISS